MDQTFVVIFETDKIDEVKSYLKQFKAYSPITKNSWAILTDKSASVVRSEIAERTNQGDKVFVIRSGTEAAWINQTQAVTNWLKKHL